MTDNLSDKKKVKTAIRALRKARIFIRTINSWAPTHNLPYNTIKRYYTTGDELASVNKALTVLGFTENDMPSSRDFDYELEHLKN